MPYDIDGMRAALQEQISPRFFDEISGASIADSFSSMRMSDGLLSERSASDCLIPRNDGNGRAIVDCQRKTASSHAIQEKVLRRIATNISGPKVFDFMEINTPQRIANECRGPNGEMWYRKPWDIKRLPPTLVSTKQASARHFACNKCDSDTFMPVENDAIAWPEWPKCVAVDDISIEQDQSRFSNQLFLLAYRCLLQRISHIRGLLASSGYAVNDRQISDGYRRILDERQYRYRQILTKLTSLKSKYDRRITGIAALPMIHRVVPVEPAFPIASMSFMPVNGRQHIATTIYPEKLDYLARPTKWRHWMILSIESGHKWLLEPTIVDKIEDAQQTVDGVQNSIEWTIKYLASEGDLSTYARPESYSLFCDQHPNESYRIEQRVANDIVLEYYERCIGKPLYID